jgi:hypothetical protein
MSADPSYRASRRGYPQFPQVHPQPLATSDGAERAVFGTDIFDCGQIREPATRAINSREFVSAKCRAELTYSRRQQAMVADRVSGGARNRKIFVVGA